jgi:colanic acid/amylovoran biosynthesis glycosyltransferase
VTSLDDVLFVLSDFPEPTQTFIHRELEHMERAGGRVHLLAGRRLPCDPGAGIAAIAARAIYLGSPASWVPLGLAWAARHPLRFASAAAWAARLPHRTPAHRARMLAMLVAAASVADQVAARGYRYLHAHFAAYQTELAMCLGRLLDLPYGVTLHAYDI